LHYFAKSVVLEKKNTMSGKVDKILQNSAFQGILRGRKNYDTSFFCMPRQDKRVDCILPQRGAVSGQITAYKKA